MFYIRHNFPRFQIKVAVGNLCFNILIKSIPTKPSLRPMSSRIKDRRVVSSRHPLQTVRSSKLSFLVTWSRTFFLSCIDIPIKPEKKCTMCTSCPANIALIGNFILYFYICLVDIHTHSNYFIFEFTVFKTS